MEKIWCICFQFPWQDDGENIIINIEIYRWRRAREMRGKILFVPDSTEGVAEGQTTAMSSEKTGESAALNDENGEHIKA